MRKRDGILVVAVVTGLCAAGVSQNDIRAKYPGRSNCVAELKSAYHYGIRLDKSQNAYLDAYHWADKNMLAIVQRKQEDETCGIIRDVVQANDSKSSFIFECSVQDASSDVVVGTRPETQRSTSGGAIEAWRIDVKGLKFVPTKGPVRCVNRDYSGNDEGDDLVTWAKKRASTRSSTPKQ